MKLVVGMVAPNAYELNLTADGVDVDLSTVTSAVFKVQKPRGAGTATWSATLSNQTTTTLRLTHTFASGDLDVAGPWTLYASLTLAGGAGTLPTSPLSLPVAGEFDVTA